MQNTRQMGVMIPIVVPQSWMHPILFGTLNLGENGKILDKFANLSNPQNWGKKSKKVFSLQQRVSLYGKWFHWILSKFTNCNEQRPMK